MSAGRRTVTGIAGIVALLLVVVGCAGDSRPGTEEWARRWEAVRELVPAADELRTDQQATCDRLLGELRAALPSLTPTPDEALDDAVSAWGGAAETLAFDCPTDRAELDDRLAELAIIADQVDAGLADLR